MFLEEIIKLKKARVAAAKTGADAEAVRAAALAVRADAQKYRLHAGLSRDGINVIAEYKRASPSKGIINDALDVADVAREYEAAGAVAMSVLTEEDRFKGALDDLKRARAAVAMPLLRKDFMLDEFQFYEAAAAGADAVLLIVAMLSDDDLARYLQLAESELEMDAIVEVHTLDELRRANALGATIIGVNNRDLKSFHVTLDVSRELIGHKRPGTLMICESGLSTADEIREMRALGFDGFLIGEAFMRNGTGLLVSSS